MAGTKVLSLPDATVTIWEEVGGVPSGAAILEYAYCEGIDLVDTYRIDEFPQFGEANLSAEVIEERLTLSIASLYFKKSTQFQGAFASSKKYYLTINFLEPDTGQNETYTCHTCTPVSRQISGRDPDVVRMPVTFAVKSVT